MNDLQAVGWYVLYYFGQATWWLLVVLCLLLGSSLILLPAYFILKWNLNKLENKLSAADAEWLAVVFEDAVVGDATSLYHKLTMFVENDDINDADTQP